MMLFLILAYSSSLFYYINVPVVDMRITPNEKEMIGAQAFYSEQVVPLEEQGEWVKIQNFVDRSLGWVKKNSLHERKDEFNAEPTKLAKISRIFAHLYAEKDTIKGPLITLPYDSKLIIKKEIPSKKNRWIQVSLPDDRTAYVQRGDITINPSKISMEEMVKLSKKFIDLPYTWSGRSGFGYDCSGFIQMLYRQMGIIIPRSTRAQIRSEMFEDISIDELKPGDLVFYGKLENKPIHVSLYLGDGKLIHSTVADNSPYIHINDITEPTWNGKGVFPFRKARRLKKDL